MTSEVTQADIQAAAAFSENVVGLTREEIKSLSEWFRGHRTAAERAAAERERELVGLVRKLMFYIPTETLRCNGDKCRQPHCASCFGDDTANIGLQEASSDLARASSALAKYGEQDD